jgi:hypothetical protein
MKTLTVTTAGNDSILLGQAPFYLLSFEGYADTDADTVTIENIQRDGVTYIESFLEPKDINLIVRLRAGSPTELNELRKQTSRIFSPKNGLLTLLFKDESGEFTIQAVCEHMPKFGGADQRTDGVFQNVQLSLLAPSPYWQTTESIEKPLYAWVPRFTFPNVWGTTTAKTTVFGTKGEAETVENTGGDGAPVLITITGFVDRPTVTNQTTGEFITLNTTIEAGERVEINTDDNNLTIDLIDELGIHTDIFSRMSIDSTLFKLAAGENLIEYTAVTQDEFSTVSFTYNQLFAGI